MYYQSNFKRGLNAQKILETLILKKNYQILERNWRHKKLGEIDLIIKKTSPNTIIFVEVKYRSKSLYGDGLNTVNINKQLRIKKLASIYLNLHPEMLTFEVKFFVSSFYKKELKFYEF